MDDPNLQERFARELRKALGMAGDAAQSSVPVVNVQPAQVSVSPRIVAELPALPQPLQVLDVAQHAAAFEWELRPERNADGLLIRARMVPIARIDFGEVSNDR